MIGYLKGEVTGIYDDRILLEVGGIGYNVLMPASALNALSGLGDEIKVYTYLAVREDAMQLYGFLTKDDLDIYKMLITVNGIGPKAALSILSVLSSDELRFAVLSSDVKAISAAPGIGAKSAQRVIIELKDKFSLEDTFEQTLNRNKNKSENSELSSNRKEAAQALTSLGYSSSDAYRAIKEADIEPEDDVETILKKALKHISIY